MAQDHWMPSKADISEYKQVKVWILFDTWGDSICSKKDLSQTTYGWSRSAEFARLQAAELNKTGSFLEAFGGFSYDGTAFYDGSLRRTAESMGPEIDDPRVIALAKLTPEERKLLGLQP